MAYDKNIDYSYEIEKAKSEGRDTSALEASRAEKIADVYGGKEPNMWNSTQTYSQAASSGSAGQAAINASVAYANQNNPGTRVGAQTNYGTYDPVTPIKKPEEDKPAFEVGDHSQYLADMYAANTESQLAALKDAYEKNQSSLQYAADKIPETYQTARNDTAAQNEVARQNLQEYFAARGLNTGTAGQMELSNSGALQKNLGEISTQEANAVTDNQRAQNDLEASYRNAIVEAVANNDSQMAQALYNEMVRQEQAKMGLYEFDTSLDFNKQQMANSNQQWQQQFNASNQQYQDSLAAAAQKQAYNLATTMLGMGVMPEAATLQAAGISPIEANAIQSAYLAQQAAKVKTPSSNNNPVVSNPTGTKTLLTGSDYNDALARVISAGKTAAQRTAALKMLNQNGLVKDSDVEKIFAEITSGKYD